MIFGWDDAETKDTSMVMIAPSMTMTIMITLVDRNSVVYLSLPVECH
jgi:hypothetical protein